MVAYLMNSQHDGSNSISYPSPNVVIGGSFSCPQIDYNQHVRNFLSMSISYLSARFKLKMEV